MDDPYAALGIARDASQEAVKAAYKRLAFKYHPDKNPGDAGAEARFKRVSSAYEVLGDPQRRHAHDHPPHQGAEDLMRMFRGFGLHVNVPNQVVVRLTCSLEDFHTCATKSFALPSGLERMHVPLQRGMQAGMHLAVDAPSVGRVLVRLEQAPHPLYRREGDALVHERPISLKESLLGTRVQLQDLDGAPLSFAVPGVVPPGGQHVVPGKGMYGVGPLVLRFDVRFPASLTEEQRAGLRAALP